MIEKKKKTNTVKYTAENLLKTYTQPKLFKKVNTVQLAVLNKSLSLALIKKEGGKNLSLAIIKVWLINLNDFLNIPRKMNEFQIDETADLIYDDFYYFKISDISLIIKRIKTGFYGNLYEGIDGMKIINIFYEYAQERMNYYIDNNERERENYKHNRTER